MKKSTIILVMLFFTAYASDVWANAICFQGNWRWRNDNGSETTATWNPNSGDQQTITIHTRDNIRLRVQLYTNYNGYNNAIWMNNVSLYYKKVGDSNYSKVTTDGSSNDFILSTSSNVSESDNVTNQLDNNGKQFENGYIITQSDSKSLNINPEYTNELEYCIKPSQNIKANTTYSFKIMVSDGNELNNYGTEITLSTGIDILGTPLVSTQSITGIDATSATGNGTITSLGLSNITSYGLCWNKFGLPTIASDTTELGDTSSTGSFIALLKGLSPNTLYFVRSFATNSYGTTYGNQAIYQNGTLTNNALDFTTNISNYVDLGTLNPTDNFSNGFTFMCWVNFKSFEQWSRIFDFGNGSPSDNLLLGVHPDGSMSFHNYNGSNVIALDAPPAVLKTNKWTHIAVTTSSSGLEKMYVNGTLIASGSGLIPTNIARTHCYLGKSNWSDAYLNAQMDEVSIWTKDLSKTEIQNYLKTPITGSELGLYTYYNFNEGIANADNDGYNTLADLSSTDQHGTITNFTLTGTTSNFVSGYSDSLLLKSIDLSTNVVTLDSANGSNATIDVNTLANWTATSDQLWLTVSPSTATSGFGNLTLTATGNGASLARTATVTITAPDVTPLTISVTQKGISTFAVTSKAGTLYSLLSSTQKQFCTKLTITDTIDARDFVTIRDSLPSLDTLDLSGAKIVAYSGNEGTDTYGWHSYDYNENTLPQCAFYNQDRYQGHHNLKRILLPNSLTEIGSQAIDNCINIGSLSIPASVKTIAYYAIEECENLTTVTFESNSQLDSIGEGAFYDDYSLQSIVIPASVSSISDYAFYNGESLTSVSFESNTNLKTIGYEAFYNCSDLSSITIPASVTSIQSEAFQYCYNLSTVTFEANSKLSLINQYAFYNCTSLDTIIIPASVKTISNSAFNECRNLYSVTFEANSKLDYIGNGAFNDCVNLTSITIPASVTTMLSGAFEYCELLTAVTFEANSKLTNIQDQTFYGCYSLNGITIPASVTSIGSEAFSECNNLGSLTFETNSKLESIGYNAFYDCYNNLSSIIIPASVKTISEGAFEYCSNLNSVKIESNSNLTLIGYAAFGDCNSLKSIAIPASVTEINSNAFNGCEGLKSIFTASITPVDLSGSSNVFNNVDKSACKLLVPYGSKALYQTANQWQDFNTITEVLPLCDSINGSVPVVDQNIISVVTNTPGYSFEQYFRFKPTANGEYTFYSDYNNGGGSILDENGDEISGGYNLDFTEQLDSGRVYYIGMVNFDGDGIATNISITGGDLQGFVYTGSNNWDNTSNWNWAILPEVYNNVTVKGELAINHDISVTNFTVLPNASVTVDNGLKLHYANLTIVNDTTGSASFISDNTNLTATVQEYVKSGRNWYISSPMSASTSGVVTANASNKLWNYDESNLTWNSIANTSTSLSVMSGFVANNAADGFVSFTEGYLNTGTQTININKTGTDEKSGFNLIGNPYPSSVDWTLATLSNVDSTIWYRTQNKNNVYVFDTYNAASGIGTNNNGNAEVTQFIAPLQAVWVKVSDSQTSGSITFDNNAKAHNSDRLKSGKAKNRVVRLQVSNGINNDETIVIFNDNASDSVDGFDSPKMFVNNSSVPEIYSAVGKKKCVINGMKSIDSTKVIYLGFKAAKKGKYSISATEISGIDGTTVVLEDKLLSKTQDLTIVPTYSFESDSVDNASRFVLHLKSGNETTASTIESKSEINIYSVGNTAVVSTSADNANGTVTVFDILGQTIASAKINGTKTEIALPTVTAAYFVKVETNKSTLTKEVTIN